MLCVCGYYAGQCYIVGVVVIKLVYLPSIIMISLRAHTFLNSILSEKGSLPNGRYLLEVGTQQKRKSSMKMVYNAPAMGLHFKHLFSS